MLIGRMGRPGLLGLAARTAVVAGTVGAVNGAMRNRQLRRSGELDEQQAWEQQQQQQAMQAAAQQAAAAQQVGAGTAEGRGSAVDQLERLAALQQQGILSAAEFEAQKAKILAG